MRACMDPRGEAPPKNSLRFGLRFLWEYTADPQTFTQMNWTRATTAKYQALGTELFPRDELMELFPWDELKQLSAKLVAAWREC